MLYTHGGFVVGSVEAFDLKAKLYADQVYEVAGSVAASGGRVGRCEPVTCSSRR
jgi:hypothetical protein